jgi:Glycosyltransferase family 87
MLKARASSATQEGIEVEVELGRPGKPASQQGGEPSGTKGTGLARRARLYLIVVPLGAFLFAWIWAVSSATVAYNPGPNGAGLGFDFAVYYSAAHVLERGGNPYDRHSLYRVEYSFLHSHRLPISPEKSLIRVGEPPIFFWALEPLTRLPFQTAAVLWMLAMYAFSAIGFVAALRYCGWNRVLLPLLILLVVPQTVDEVYYANDVAIIVAALGLCLLLLKKQPAIAGALLALAWLKPQVALPVVVLIILFHPQAQRRLALGFGLATTLLALATGIATRWNIYLQWFAGLAGWSHDLAAQQNIASLGGLYLHWASPGARLVLEVAVLLAAAAATGALWWRQRHAASSSLALFACLWAVWFLASPYAHFYDEPLLAVPVLVLLGRNARRISDWLPALTLYALMLSIFFVGRHMPVSPFWIPVALLALGLALRLRRGRTKIRDDQAVSLLPE